MLRFLLPGLCLLVSCTNQSTEQKVTTASASDKEVLIKNEYNWLKSEFALDTASISKMMHDSFVAISPDGILNKNQELNAIYENISQRLKNNHIVDSFYLDEVRVNMFENTAVVSFTSVTKGRKNGSPFQNRKVRWLDTWIKENNVWKAISSSGLPVP